MKKLLTLTALACAATTLNGAILYSASVGCSQTCVSVSLSWAAETFPVNFATVENSLDDSVLFSLTLGPSAGQTTGSIVPFPQTVGPLSTSAIATIESGEAYIALTQIQPGFVGSGDGPTSDGTPFLPDVPEPGTLWLGAAGLTFLFWRALAVRRQS